MKQPLIVFFLLVSVCLTLSQCRDLAAHIDHNFVGVWNGTDGVSTFRMSIDNGSNGYWHQSNHGVSSTAQGVARVKHGKLFIGLKAFTIDQYPQDSAGVWTMILSGVDYTKQ